MSNEGNILESNFTKYELPPALAGGNKSYSKGFSQINCVLAKAIYFYNSLPPAKAGGN